MGTQETRTEDARTENQRTLLRAQPWGRILKQLTTLAHKRIPGRPLSDAEDLAQSAIADAYRNTESGGWDPEKGPLQGFLVSNVIGAANNERRRKRNVCEVWLDEEDEAEEEDAGSKYEKYLAADQPAADEALHRLRFARTFHDRLVARLEADPLPLLLIPHMQNGVSKPDELAKATGHEKSEIVEALRRIKYHARETTKELSASAGTPRTGARSEEVTQ